MTESNPTLTQEYLKEILHCDIDIGIFTWKVNRGRVNIGKIAGTLTKEGYISIHIDGKRYLGHRLIWLYAHGEFPSCELDHINHIRNDNAISNLRSVTHHENGRNQSINSKNTSGIVGVCFDGNRKKWCAYIYVMNKRIWLGSFSEKEDAVKARKIGEKIYGYHENHGSY